MTPHRAFRRALERPDICMHLLMVGVLATTMPYAIGPLGQPIGGHPIAIVLAIWMLLDEHVRPGWLQAVTAAWPTIEEPPTGRPELRVMARAGAAGGDS